MNWKINYLPEANDEILSLDNSVRRNVKKTIERVAQNPLPKIEGGYGEPLGNKRGINLTGLFKIKFKGIGQRVVYALERTGNTMNVIIISARADNEVYGEAYKRRKKYGI